MSFKALIIGDLHWRHTNPIARLDNYQAALAAKLRECWQLAEEHNVDAILQTGDVFDSPSIVYTTLADLIHVLRDAPAPIFTIPGNHDLFASSPESLYRTPLGFLFQLNLLTNAARVHKTWADLGVQLSGRGYDASTDLPDGRTYEAIISGISCISIHMTHGMLVDKPLPSRHTLIKDIEHLENAPHVLINGHYHLGTGIQRVGETLVINPGALCRNSAAIEELERPVQVALLTIDGTEYDAELITLKSARPGREVLSREHLIKQAEAKQRRDDFGDLLASEEAVKALDVAEMMQSIAERQKVSVEVRDYALELLGKAQEAMSA